MRRARYSAMGLRMGMDYDETLRITPGELFDMAGVMLPKPKRSEVD